MEIDSTSAEVRVNWFFIAVALSLMTVALVAFFWLAGVLEWRGTSAGTDIRLVLECKDLSKLTRQFDVAIDLEDDEDAGHASAVEFSLSTEDDEFRSACQRIEIQTSRLPLRLVDAGSIDAPGDDQFIHVQTDVGVSESGTPLFQSRVGLSEPFYTATIDAAPRLKFLFLHDELMRFVGLSEREVGFSFSVSVKGAGQPGLHTKSLTFALRPPENFSVSSSDVPLKLEGHRYWATETFIQGEANSVSLKNSSLARLDHILDASISALFGAGVGALLASWLNLRVKKLSQKAD